jgi:hypothetical protein
MLPGCLLSTVVVLAGIPSDGETSRDEFARVANRMIKAINAAEFETLCKEFNEEMSKAFPETRCREIFTKLTKEFGKIKSLDAPRFPSAAAALFVLHCEHGSLDFTLNLDAMARVAGMRFVPHVDEVVPEKNESALALPFNSRWLVVWGGDTAELNHHHGVRSQRFAFDLIGVGPDGKTYKQDRSRNENFYAFGREILAPADGVVTEAIDGVRDNAPGSMNPFSAVGNAVFIQHGKNEVSVLAHLKQGSVRVKAGDQVKRGQVLGLCGNSGNSSEPHLHYHLQNGVVMQDAAGIKCFFDKLVVTKQETKETKTNYSPVKGDIISSD